jgi:hypothetical protein
MLHTYALRMTVENNFLVEEQIAFDNMQMCNPKHSKLAQNTADLTFESSLSISP